MTRRARHLARSVTDPRTVDWAEPVIFFRRDEEAFRVYRFKYESDAAFAERSRRSSELWSRFRAEKMTLGRARLDRVIQSSGVPIEQVVFIEEKPVDVAVMTASACHGKATCVMLLAKRKRPFLWRPS